jgi:hypothetical protein
MLVSLAWLIVLGFPFPGSSSDTIYGDDPSTFRDFHISPGKRSVTSYNCIGLLFISKSLNPDGFKIRNSC